MRRRVKTASARPSRTAAAATASSRVSGSGVMRRPLSQGADGGGHALAGGDGGDAEPVGDALVVEVVDEAQPQRGLRAVRQRRDQRLEGALVVGVVGRHGRRRRRSGARGGGRGGGRSRSWWSRGTARRAGARRGAAADRRAGRAAARPAARPRRAGRRPSRRAWASSSSPWRSTRTQNGGSITFVERGMAAEREGRYQPSAAIVVGTSSWADPGFVEEWYPQRPAGARAAALVRRALRGRRGQLDLLRRARGARPCSAGRTITPDGFTFDVKLHRLLSRHSRRARLAAAGPARAGARPPTAGRVRARRQRSRRRSPTPCSRPSSRWSHAGKLASFLLQLSPAFGPRSNELDELAPLIEPASRRTRWRSSCAAGSLDCAASAPSRPSAWIERPRRRLGLP